LALPDDTNIRWCSLVIAPRHNHGVRGLPNTDASYPECKALRRRLSPFFCSRCSRCRAVDCPSALLEDKVTRRAPRWQQHLGRRIIRQRLVSGRVPRRWSNRRQRVQRHDYNDGGAVLTFEFFFSERAYFVSLMSCVLDNNIRNFKCVLSGADFIVPGRIIRLGAG
jgi:hypothetical protein